MSWIKRVTSFLKVHKKEVIFFILIYCVLLINSVHENYPDEMDNILGGYLINKGVLPYTGFFTHHGPLAYYLASFLTFFAGQSFVTFRLLSSLFFIFFLIGNYILFRKIVRKETSFFLFYIAVFSLSSTFFWAHMFLADPISGYLLIPAYGVLFLKGYQNKNLTRSDLLVISVFSSLSLINSPTYVYSVFVLACFSFFYFLFHQDRQQLRSALFKRTLYFAGIFVLPYVLFLLFLFITKSLYDYYFQALLYNRNYYLYNYPRPEGSTAFNPIRYAVIILDSFLNAYQVLLAGIKNVDFINPVNVTLALSNVVLWIFLLVKKRYFLILLSLLLLIFANVRSNPLKFGATDYQASVYVMLSFFNAGFILYTLKDEGVHIQGYIARILLTLLSVMLVIYWFFTIVFFFQELWRMSYLRYMGQMPLIYDRPQVARVVNDVVPSHQYCWIGPFEFEEMLYLTCKLPSRFHIIRPLFIKIPSIQKEMISDLSRHKPDIIVYKRKIFSVDGVSREDRFFIDFLNKEYVRLKDLGSQKRYYFRNQKTKDFTLDEDFNFEKTKAEALVKKLFEKGYLTR